MSATSMSRMVLLAFVGACGISLAFAIQHFRREPPVDTKTALAAPAVSRPAFDARDQGHGYRGPGDTGRKRARGANGIGQRNWHKRLAQNQLLMVPIWQKVENQPHRQPTTTSLI